MAKAAFDILVAGGGHAGLEAALAAARLGWRTALITHDPLRIGALSCNPAMGGLAKGHLIKEIDALGGEIGLLSDVSAIQFRRLNTRKGPAVRATRAQMDRRYYLRAAYRAATTQPNLTVITGEAVEVLTSGGRAAGLRLRDGRNLAGRAVILTTGTFLNGRVHIGQTSFSAGRLGDAPSLGLTESLQRLGLETGRLKTGTPARIVKTSVDFSRLEVQPPDAEPRPFSALTKSIPLPQVPCHVTRTTEATHDIIRRALDRSALFSGRITGIGARYCPSIEDKIVKFPDKLSHHVFIEPEGLTSPLLYPNGVSTSLPLDVQEEMIHSLPGLERAELAAPGYAIEYDFVSPVQLGPDLMVKTVPGLYHAGQINGTSGYEEAAGQGLMAGLNAARRLADQEPIVLTRDRAYIGVMIDDLTTLGADEPYRMFTSRAEYRLLLREDNAAERLTALGREWGLVSDARWAAFNRRRDDLDRARHRLGRARIRPTEPVNRALAEAGAAPLTDAVAPLDLLRRPELDWDRVMGLLERPPSLAPDEAEALETEIKYAGYVVKQREQVARFKDLESRLLPTDFNYTGLAGLSREMVEKLNRVRPRSIGQAARIPGVTPAALMIISVQASRKENQAA